MIRFTSLVVAAYINKRNLFLSVALAVGVVFFALEWHVQRDAAAFYSHALHEEHISESVFLDGAAYAITEGAVTRNGKAVSGSEEARALRLAYAKALARRSPFMALPGTDPAILRSAISALSATQRRLAQMQKTPRNSALVLSGLYPLSFLTALASTEEARVQFIESGSDADERLYRLALEETFAEYQRDLEQFRTSFEKAVPDDAPSYSASGAIVTKQGIDQALDMISSGALEIQDLVHDRERCLAGDTSGCAPGDLAFPTPAAPDMQDPGAVELARAADIRALLATGTGHPEITADPILELATSTCASQISAPPLFLTYDSGALPTGEVFERPLFLGDIMLIDSTAQEQLPFFRYFADHGITHVFTSPLSYYKCPLNGYDMGKIFGIQAVIQFARSTPASAFAHGSTAQALRRMEEHLTASSGAVTEKMAAEYVREAQTALETWPDETAQNALTSVALQMNDRSAHFDNMLAEIVGTENTNGNLAGEDISIPLDAPYLFYVRNGFISLFLAWNPSAVDISEPLFPPNQAPFDRQPFILYSSLSGTPGARTALIRDLQFYFNVHHNAKTPVTGSGI